jgi:hypothetical protein
MLHFPSSGVPSAVWAMHMHAGVHQFRRSDFHPKLHVSGSLLSGAVTGRMFLVGRGPWIISQNSPVVFGGLRALTMRNLVEALEQPGRGGKGNRCFSLSPMACFLPLNRG